MISSEKINSKVETIKEFRYHREVSPLFFNKNQINNSLRINTLNDSNSSLLYKYFNFKKNLKKINKNLKFINIFYVEFNRIKNINLIRIIFDLISNYSFYIIRLYVSILSSYRLKNNFLHFSDIHLLSITSSIIYLKKIIEIFLNFKQIDLDDSNLLRYFKYIDGALRYILENKLLYKNKQTYLSKIINKFKCNLEFMYFNVINTSYLIIISSEYLINCILHYYVFDFNILVWGFKKTINIYDWLFVYKIYNSTKIFDLYCRVDLINISIDYSMYTKIIKNVIGNSSRYLLFNKIMSKFYIYTDYVLKKINHSYKNNNKTL